MKKTDVLEKLGRKEAKAEDVAKDAIKDSSLLHEIFKGVSSTNARIRYGCAKVLMDFSEEYPQQLYKYVDFFTELLESKYRILIWNAMAILANLAKVDTAKKFDAIFDKYYSFLNDEYMVTVANVVGFSGKIALAKPHLIDKITNELLKVENIFITPHLTEECKRIIIQKTIKTFHVFFNEIEDKDKVISFVERYLNSSRKNLRTDAAKFLKKWG